MPLVFPMERLERVHAIGSKDDTLGPTTDCFLCTKLDGLRAGELVVSRTDRR